MLKITSQLVSEVSSQAKANTRRRQHYNFHKTYGEPIQRLLNACEPDSYFRPHNHTDSQILEILLIVRGEIVVVIFDDFGNIRDYAILSHKTLNYGVEILPNEWHSMIALEPGSVMFEIKEGPFDESRAKVFAPWAPVENSPEAEEFNALILRKLKIKI